MTTRSTHAPSTTYLLRGTHAGRSRPAGGFTVIEMVVVVVIVALLIVLAVPSFRAMMKGTEETMAESQLRSALRAAKDTAVRSGRGTDAAAAFFFTDEGRLTIVPYIRAGVLRDKSYYNERDAVDELSEVEREIFVPAQGAQTVQLPKYWTVRGFVPARYIENVGGGWYKSSASSTNAPAYNSAVENWVFPETCFFDPALSDQGSRRHTFIVRFEGGTGQMISAPVTPVLLLSPAMEVAAMNDLDGGLGGNKLLKARRRTMGQDYAGYVRELLKTNVLDPGNERGQGDPRSKRQVLLGRSSTDMVLARPVTQIALCDESRIASAIGARLRDWPALIERDEASAANPGAARFNDSALEGLDGAGVTVKINAWIDGVMDQQRNGQIEVESKVFTFDRYTGTPVRLD